MAVVRNKVEAGANGDTLNGTHVGATAVTASGATCQVSTAQKWSGTRSAFIQATGSGTAYWYKDSLSAAQMGQDQYIYLTAYPSAEIGIMAFQVGGTAAVYLALTTTGALRLRVNGAAVYTSTGVVPLNTWVRPSLFATQNASTGTARCAAYLGASSTPIANTDSTLLTGLNTGSSVYTSVRGGLKSGSGAQTITGYVDDWAYDTAATGLLAPESATPPTLPATPGEDYFVFIDMSSTTFAVGPGSFSATPSTDVVATLSGVFVPVPADGSDATFNVVATDTGNGASDDMDVTVALPISTQDVIETVSWNGTAWE